MYWITCLTVILAGNFHEIQAQTKARKYKASGHRSYQEFDVVQDYKGQTHLVLRLLASFEKNTTQVIVMRSIDGKKWVDISKLNIQKGYKASLQNVPLSFELSATKELLKDINKQVFFRVIPSHNGKRTTACGFAQISKEKLLKLQAEAQTAHHLTQRYK